MYANMQLPHDTVVADDQACAEHLKNYTDKKLKKSSYEPFLQIF